MQIAAQISLFKDIPMLFVMVLTSATLPDLEDQIAQSESSLNQALLQLQQTEKQLQAFQGDFSPHFQGE